MPRGDDESSNEKFRSCLVGGAVGGAVGRQLARVPAKKRRALALNLPVDNVRGAISAETQLTLFTAEGLIRAAVRYANKGICNTAAVVHHAYLRWLWTQGLEGARQPFDGPKTGWLSRVPALHHKRNPDPETVGALMLGVAFEPADAPQTSTGHGALTRIAPVGLTADDPFGLGVEVAALTHGDATAEIAAGFFAVMVKELTAGESIATAIAHARRPVEQHRNGGNVLIAIDRAVASAHERGDPGEIVRELGEAQTADKVLLVALFCAQVAESFQQGIALAISAGGHAPATASLVGTVLGMVSGSSAIPREWLAPLEMHEEILAIADDLARMPRENLESNEWWTRYPGF